MERGGGGENVLEEEEEEDPVRPTRAIEVSTLLCRGRRRRRRRRRGRSGRRYIDIFFERPVDRVAHMSAKHSVKSPYTISTNN